MLLSVATSLGLQLLNGNILGSHFNSAIVMNMQHAMCRVTLFPFPLKIPTGSKEVKRTTIPFLYNMDGSIQGLDVVDFPGVDDQDESIEDLANLILKLAQIVIFVVNYRYIITSVNRSLS